jgi:4-hydroxy-tetrahydrodipicolinate synthase
MTEGIWAAVLTPVDGDFSPDAAKAIPYYRDLLRRGCDGINLLGTTGEAMSLCSDARLRFMEAMASSGVPMGRMMVGTGAASLRDAVRLTSRAFACGFVAALVMPPFFYREATDDGILAFFEALFSRANAPPRSVLLYNFPRMSGVTFHPDLVDRLTDAFPGIIAGVKDSSNSAELQSELASRHRDLAIFPGSESDLPSAIARGAAGCISGSVALWPQLAQAVFSAGNESRGNELSRRRAALSGLPFVAAVRHLTSLLCRDSAWGRPIPPLVPLAPEQQHALERGIEPLLETVT